MSVICGVESMVMPLRMGMDEEGERIRNAWCECRVLPWKHMRVATYWFRTRHSYTLVPV